MEDDWGKETNNYIKLAKDIKGIVVDLCNDKCSSEAREFITFGNNKKTYFSTRVEGENLARIHEQLEESISSELRAKYNTLTKNEEVGIKKVIMRSFSPFKPGGFYNTYYKKKSIKQETLESKFYQNLEYREPFIFRVSSVPPEEIQIKENDIIKEDKFIESFMDFIMPYAIQGTSPKPIVLSGEIGSGKTTAFGKMIYALMEQNRKQSDPYLHPIIIDFESLLEFKENGTKEQYLGDKNMFVNLNKKIKTQLLKIKTEGGKNKRVKPVVFIDNMDIIFQKFSEDYFLSSSKESIGNLLLELISKSSTLDDKPIMVCGMRGESLNALKSNRGDKYRKIGNDPLDIKTLVSYVVEVKEKDAKEISSIILKRLLLIHSVMEVSGVHEHVAKVLKNNIDIFRSTYLSEESNNSKSRTYINFKEINNISAEGLRNTIDLFMRVSPASQHNDLFHRFFIDPFYIKKLHFLGDTTAYTQGGNGIFNIFLNNIEYRLNRNYYNQQSAGLGEESMEKAIGLAKLSSLQTYWAKYFILLYLYGDNINSKTATKNKENLINIFSSKNSTQRYEENLIRLLLLGLSESRHGKILNIVLNESQDDIDKLQLSNKGKYLLENTIWTFDYLAVVVEDFWLEMPEFILKKYPVLLENVESYCFLSNKNNFNGKRKDSLFQKIQKVKLFLDILEVSYSVEIVRVKKIFDRLKAQNEENQKFNLPDFKEIRKSLKVTIETYANVAGLKINDKLDFMKYSLGFWERRELATFFKKNYGTHLSFDSDSVLDYHKNNSKKVDSVLY